MNAPFNAHWLDGQRLASREVTVVGEGATLHVHGLDAPCAIPLAQVRVSDRLARVPRFLYLSDGKSLETADNDAVDALFASRGRTRIDVCIDWLERRSRVAAAAAVLLVASVSALIYFGLPAAARRAAQAVPATIERQAGEAALGTLSGMLGESRLDRKARARVAAQLDRVTRAQKFPTAPRLEFRAMGKFPNAFALPGGILVISDELVDLANDDELAAVLAHEIAHWQLRHGAQTVFRGSAALLIVSTVTGDLSTLTSFTASFPVLLLQRGYSREFEQEADTYAVAALKQAGIDPRSLATILTKLERARPDEGADYSYLSTHPSTSDRARKIDPTGTFESLLEKPEVAEAPAASTNSVPPTTPVTPPPSPAKVKSVMFNSGNHPERKTAGTAPASAFSWAQLEIPPTPVDRVPPEYPSELRTAGVTGMVSLEFIIDHEGDVVAAEVVRSTHPGFEQVALDAVMKWKFNPGRKNGRTVNTRASIDIPFTLTED
jgi:TonB family protein